MKESYDCPYKDKCQQYIDKYKDPDFPSLMKSNHAKTPIYAKFVEYPGDTIILDSIHCMARSTGLDAECEGLKKVREKIKDEIKDKKIETLNDFVKEK